MPARTLPELFRALSDADWYRLLAASVTRPVIDGFEFPAFPPAALQETFVGASGKAALQPAYSFYVFVKTQMQSLGHPLTRESRFLDFGCGWGRFLRFFWKDVDEGNLFGCDTQQTIINLCKDCGVPGQLAAIHPLGPLPYPDGFFDGVLAYSVFTHLPENVHLHWAQELARVCRPGGIVCMTLESRRFLDMIAETLADSPYPRLASLARFRPVLGRHATEHATRGFTYFPSVAGLENVFGDAVCTAGFMVDTWGRDFDLKTYIDHASQMSQAAVALQRRSPDGLPLDGRIETEIREIRRSGLFDEAFYRAMYPNVQTPPTDPIHHYCARGWREGRNPSETFDTLRYQAANPDIARAGVNPLWHYAVHGRSEGRLAIAGDAFGFEDDIHFGLQPDDTRLIAYYALPDPLDARRTREARQAGDHTLLPHSDAGTSAPAGAEALAKQATLCRSHGIAAWCFRVDAARAPDPASPLLSLLDAPEIGIGLILDLDLRGGCVDEQARKLFTRALADDRCLRVDGRPVVVLTLPDDDEACRAALPATEVLVGPPGTMYRIARRDGLATSAPVIAGRRSFDAILDAPLDPVLPDAGGMTPWEHDGAVTIPYAIVVSQAIARMTRTRDASVPCQRMVMAGRDESPPHRPRPLRYTRPTLKEYRRWLDAAIADARETLPPGARLVFLDAFNDWRRGAVLEPDLRGGYGRLNETSRALLGLPSGACIPKVSVIVMGTGDATHLRRRLESVARQTYRNVEVLLLADGPADESRDIIAEYALQHPETSKLLPGGERSDGIFRRWARGIEAASGALVWIAGGEGACDDDLLANLVRCFDDEAVMVACARTEPIGAEETAMTDDLGDRAGESGPRGARRRSRVITAHLEVAGGLETVIGIADAGSAVFRRPIDMGLLGDEAWVSSSVTGDWIFYLHAMRGGRIAYCAETCARVRGGFWKDRFASASRETIIREVDALTRNVEMLYDAPASTIEMLRRKLLVPSAAAGREHTARREISPSDPGILTPSRLRSPNVAVAAAGFFPGGAEVFPIRLANEFKRQGHAVLFLSSGLIGREPGVRHLLRNDIPVIETHDVTTIKGLFEEFGIEVVNSHHWIIQNYTATVADVFAGLKAHVASLHGMLEHGNEGTVTADNLRLADGSVSTWVYTTEKNVRPFIELGLYDARSPRFVKLPNGMEPPVIEPLPRVALGIPDDAFVLCCVSRAIPDKGWAEAIEAVARARSMAGMDIRLLLVGNGPVYDEYCRSGTPPFVSLLGFHHDSVGCYAAADMGLMLTKFKSESFPLTIIDSLFAGKPFIATDVGEIRAMLTTDHGLAGEVIELVDWEVPVERAAEAIARHASRPELLENARERAAEAVIKFRIDRVAAAYVDLFERDVNGAFRNRIRPAPP
jgi:glycosyltransferase involved in cell wall biosynthesis/SAM-dependent methyltransferase